MQERYLLLCGQMAHPCRDGVSGVLPFGALDHGAQERQFFFFGFGVHAAGLNCCSAGLGLGRQSIFDVVLHRCSGRDMSHRHARLSRKNGNRP